MTRIPERCAPCREGDPGLTEAEVEALLPQVPAWRREGQELVRDDELADFRAALRWLNRVGMVAEDHEHHPDLRLHGYKNVELRVTTHAIGALSLNDFVLARAIDRQAAADGV